MKKFSVKRKYSGYTLLEMLIVLTIFIILSVLGMSAFEGFRDTISLNEDIDKLKQVIRGTQRSAMFLDREPSEGWVYGVGIDFTQLGVNGSYRIFKWCAPFDEYGDIRSKQEIPHYNSGLQIGPTNANIPTNYSTSALCARGEGISTLVKKAGEIEGAISSNFKSSLKNIGNNTPAYILFESVSGKTFFYTEQQGLLINYDANAQMVSNPANFVIEIESPNTGRLKTITINNISGKTKVEDSKL